MGDVLGPEQLGMLGNDFPHQPNLGIQCHSTTGDSKHSLAQRRPEIHWSILNVNPGLINPGLILIGGCPLLVVGFRPLLEGIPP